MKVKYPQPKNSKASYDDADAQRGFKEVSKAKTLDNRGQENNNSRGSTLEERVQEYLIGY